MSADLLVKLYELPDLAPSIQRQESAGVRIRRAIAPEKHVVIDWVRKTFGKGWASETEVAYTRQPISCFIAVENEQIIGFACYDAVCKDFFGPTGVEEVKRGRGIGQALLLACLHAMYDEGYGYGIIGAAGPIEFYEKVVGATVIENSWPGIYRGMLQEKK